MMSLREVIAWYRALPTASGWLKAAWLVALLASVVGLLATLLVGLLLNDHAFAVEGAKMRGSWSAALLMALSFLPLPVWAKFLIVPVVALMVQAYWGARAIELRDYLLAFLFTGMATALVVLCVGEALNLPLPSVGISMVTSAAVGALLGLVSITLARRSDPPRKGLAYGV